MKRRLRVIPEISALSGTLDFVITKKILKVESFLRLRLALFSALFCHGLPLFFALEIE
jgi:hypothetical protein